MSVDDPQYARGRLKLYDCTSNTTLQYTDGLPELPNLYTAIERKRKIPSVF